MMDCTQTVPEYLMVYRKKTGWRVKDSLKQYSKEMIKASKVKDGFESASIWQLHIASHSTILPSPKKEISYHFNKSR